MAWSLKAMLASWYLVYPEIAGDVEQDRRTVENRPTGAGEGEPGTPSEGPELRACGSREEQRADEQG